jgi:hypothetical protein
MQASPYVGNIQNMLVMVRQSYELQWLKVTTADVLAICLVSTHAQCLGLTQAQGCS